MEAIKNLQSFGRLVSYRTSSIATAPSPQSIYASFKRGMIHAAESIVGDLDPVFDVIDFESLGHALGGEVSLPFGALTRSTSPKEKLCLSLLLRLQKPEVIFELGTYRGGTTLLLFRNAPEDARIFSVDIPSDADAAPALDRARLIDLAASGLADPFERDLFPQSERVTQLYADLRRVDWAEMRALPRPDLVFIDADHSFEGCLRDTRGVLDWVSEDAMVVWHDAKWRNFKHMEAKYGVHASIVEATQPAERAFTFRVRDTSLIVRSRRHQALLREHRLAK